MLGCDAKFSSFVGLGLTRSLPPSLPARRAARRRRQLLKVVVKLIARQKAVASSVRSSETNLKASWTLAEREREREREKVVKEMHESIWRRREGKGFKGREGGGKAVSRGEMGSKSAIISTMTSHGSMALPAVACRLHLFHFTVRAMLGRA